MIFDPAQVSYEDLVRLFFETNDARRLEAGDAVLSHLPQEILIALTFWNLISGCRKEASLLLNIEVLHYLYVPKLFPPLPLKKRKSDNCY